MAAPKDPPCAVCGAKSLLPARRRLVLVVTPAKITGLHNPRMSAYAERAKIYNEKQKPIRAVYWFCSEDHREEWHIRRHNTKEALNVAEDVAQAFDGL